MERQGKEGWGVGEKVEEGWWAGLGLGVVGKVVVAGFGLLFYAACTRAMQAVNNQLADISCLHVQMALLCYPCRRALFPPFFFSRLSFPPLAFFLQASNCCLM